MGTLENYRGIIQKILTEYAQIPYAYGDIQIQTVFDSDSDRYLLIILGRENDIRVHGCLVQVDIIDGKIWIQRDGTEEGIANELVAGGIPKEQIVLGFRAPHIRQYTGFAVN